MIKIIAICVLVVFILSLALYVWYDMTIKRPEDKRMKEEQKHLTNYEKYKNEIRNFKK